MAKKKEIEKLIMRYKADIAALEEKEEDITRRIEILENLLPSVLVWYMWKVSQARREVPFPQHESQEEAKARIEHLESVLEQLQEADRLLKEEEQVMRKRIEELESLANQPDEYDEMLLKHEGPPKKPEGQKEFKEYKFDDLLKSEDTDWKNVCEDLLKQVSELNEELKNSTEQLEQSEEYVKQLEDKCSKLEKELQEKIKLLKSRTARPQVADDEEQEEQLKKEKESEDALSAMQDALAEVRSMKETLSATYSKDIKGPVDVPIEEKTQAKDVVEAEEVEQPKEDEKGKEPEILEAEKAADSEKGPIEDVTELPISAKEEAETVVLEVPDTSEVAETKESVVSDTEQTQGEDETKIGGEEVPAEEEGSSEQEERKVSEPSLTPYTEQLSAKDEAEPEVEPEEIKGPTEEEGSPKYPEIKESEVLAAPDTEQLHEKDETEAEEIKGPKEEEGSPEQPEIKESEVLAAPDTEQLPVKDEAELEAEEIKGPTEEEGSSEHPEIEESEVLAAPDIEKHPGKDEVEAEVEEIKSPTEDQVSPDHPEITESEVVAAPDIEQLPAKDEAEAEGVESPTDRAVSLLGTSEPSPVIHAEQAPIKDLDESSDLGALPPPIEEEKGEEEVPAKDSAEVEGKAPSGETVIPAKHEAEAKKSEPSPVIHAEQAPTIIDSELEPLAPPIGEEKGGEEVPAKDSAEVEDKAPSGETVVPAKHEAEAKKSEPSPVIHAEQAPTKEIDSELEALAPPKGEKKGGEEVPAKDSAEVEGKAPSGEIVVPTKHEAEAKKSEPSPVIHAEQAPTKEIVSELEALAPPKGEEKGVEEVPAKDSAEVEGKAPSGETVIPAKHEAEAKKSEPSPVIHAEQAPTIIDSELEPLAPPIGEEKGGEEVPAKDSAEVEGKAPSGETVVPAKHEAEAKKSEPSPVIHAEQAPTKEIDSELEALAPPKGEEKGGEEVPAKDSAEVEGKAPSGETVVPAKHEAEAKKSEPSPVIHAEQAPTKEIDSELEALAPPKGEKKGGEEVPAKDSAEVEGKAPLGETVVPAKHEAEAKKSEPSPDIHAEQAPTIIDSELEPLAPPIGVEKGGEEVPAKDSAEVEGKAPSGEIVVPTKHEAEAKDEKGGISGAAILDSSDSDKLKEVDAPVTQKQTEPKKSEPSAIIHAEQAPTKEIVIPDETEISELEALAPMEEENGEIVPAKDSAEVEGKAPSGETVVPAKHEAEAKDEKTEAKDEETEPKKSEPSAVIEGAEPEGVKDPKERSEHPETKESKVPTVPDTQQAPAKEGAEAEEKPEKEKAGGNYVIVTTYYPEEAPTEGVEYPKDEVELLSPFQVQDGFNFDVGAEPPTKEGDKQTPDELMLGAEPQPEEEKESISGGAEILQSAADQTEGQAIVSEPADIAPKEPSYPSAPSAVGGQQAPGLTLAAETLQGKMRVKDHLIRTMADQLKELARQNVWAGRPELESAIGSGPHETYDFDRYLLHAYLKGEEPQNYKPTMKAGENSLNVKIARKLDKTSLMIEWNRQSSSEIAGFQIFVNGCFLYWVHSAKRNVALLHPVDLKSILEIAVTPIDAKGRMISRSTIIYKP